MAGSGASRSRCKQRFDFERMVRVDSAGAGDVTMVGRRPRTSSTASTSPTRTPCAGGLAAPADPPFVNARRTYRLEYSYGNVLIPDGEHLSTRPRFRLRRSRWRDRGLHARPHARPGVGGAARASPATSPRRASIRATASWWTSRPALPRCRATGGRRLRRGHRRASRPALGAWSRGDPPRRSASRAARSPLGASPRRSRSMW